MSRFFLRIFFSVWIILIATTTLTMFVATLLPRTDDEIGGIGYDEQLVAIVAHDLRDALQTNPQTAIDDVLGRHVLDFDRLMQIYLIGPDGRDVLDRSLPVPVSRLLRQDDLDAPLRIRDPRLDVHDEGLAGHLVVGYRTGYPLGRVLIRPWARLLLIVIALAVSATVSLILARFIVLPVRRLRRAGHQVAAGDLDVRVAHTVTGRADDIAKLARDFDLMTERVAQLIRSRQRLMRDVSHELRSPLARLQAMLSIARQSADAAGKEQIDRMEGELERLDELIGQILSFARLETQERVDRRPTDIVDLVRNIAEDAAIEGRDAGKDIRVEGPERCIMSVDAALIQSAIENLVRNALKHTEPQSSVEINVDDRGASLQLTVDDRGPGVPEDALKRIFEPFYRIGNAADHAHSGGIGLAIADRSVRLHGGTIRALNRAGGGLRVELSLPKVAASR